MEASSKEKNRDFVLVLLAWKWENEPGYKLSSNSGDTIETIYEKLVALDIEITKIDLIEIESRLLADGYIESLRIGLPLFKLTEKGYVFIKGGGYEDAHDLSLEKAFLFFQLNPNLKANGDKYKFPTETFFTYINLEKCKDAIDDLYNSLVAKELIHNETDIRNFRLIFNNSKPKKKIVWMGTPAELAYFIKLIHTKYEVIEPLGNIIWKVVANCFVDSMGKEFDFTVFRSQKVPAWTKNKIEAAANQLRQ